MRISAKIIRGGGARAGFTLVELMIVLVIVGLIAAVAMTVYLGYSRDARSAEAKALAGSVLKVLEGCAQARGSGGTCSLPDIVGPGQRQLRGPHRRWPLEGRNRRPQHRQGLQRAHHVRHDHGFRNCGTRHRWGRAGQIREQCRRGAALRCTTLSPTPPPVDSGDAC